MRKKFSRRRDRFGITRATLAEVAREVARLGVVSGGPYLNVDSGEGGTGFTIDDTGFELFIWAQITGGTNPYSWQEVTPVSPGSFLKVLNGRTGDTTHSPAYERWGNTAVPAGTPVHLYLADPLGSNGAEYEFVYAPHYGVLTTGITTPSAPVVTATGGTGTTWAYEVVAKTQCGGTLPGAAGSVSGPATLDGSHYNTVAITPVPGATSYDVYRTTAGGTPNTTGLVGNVAATANPLSLNDTGLAASGSVPAWDSSGFVGLGGSCPDAPLTVWSPTGYTGNLLDVYAPGGSLAFYLDPSGNPVAGGKPVGFQGSLPGGEQLLSGSWANQYYLVGCDLATGGLSPIAVGSNKLYACLFAPSRSGTIDQLGVYVNSGSNTHHVTFGIWKDSSLTPGAKLYGSGNTALIAGPGLVTVAPNFAFTAGSLYWVGAIFDSTDSVYWVPANSMRNVLGWTLTAAPTASADFAWAHNHGAYALPDPFDPVTSADLANTSPAFFYRCSA